MPVSVGPPRITLDKHGKEGVVYDVLVNTQVMTEMREDKTGGHRYIRYVCFYTVHSVSV
jgi:hypothetical protein